jgi:peptidoglycan/LPS O-acetylase OafA/YrhL
VSTRENRFQHIDALRGVAALAVVISHAVAAFLAFSSAAEQKIVRDAMCYVGFGRFGVFLFFMISGFVIPFSLRGERLAGLRAFAISRFYRLYPLYWASIVLALLAMRATGISAGEVADPFSRDALLINATMLQSFFGFEGLQIVYWSLHAELAFYVFTAAMFGFGLLRNARAILAAGAVFLVLGAAQASGWRRFAEMTSLALVDDLALAFMMLGLLWRLAFFEKEAAKTEFFVLLALVCGSVPLIEWREGVTGGASLSTAFLNAIIDSANLGASIATFALFGVLAKLRFRVMRWLGEISYSIYLLHLPVLLAVEKLVSPHIAGAPLAVHLLIAMPLITGVSHLAYRLVETPMIAEGRRRIAAPPQAGGALGAHAH